MADEVREPGGTIAAAATGEGDLGDIQKATNLAVMATEQGTKGWMLATRWCAEYSIRETRRCARRRNPRSRL